MLAEKLVYGPVWDFNLSLGNANYNDNENPYDFYILYTAAYDQLLKRRSLADLVVKRWNELRKTLFSDENIEKIIDDAVLILEEPAKRNFERWPELFDGRTYIWPNPAPYTTSWKSELRKLKIYIKKRTKWLDENIHLIYNIRDSFYD